MTCKTLEMIECTGSWLRRGLIQPLYENGMGLIGIPRLEEDLQELDDGSGHYFDWYYRVDRKSVRLFTMFKNKSYMPHTCHMLRGTLAELCASCTVPLRANPIKAVFGRTTATRNQGQRARVATWGLTLGGWLPILASVQRFAAKEPFLGHAMLNRIFGSRGERLATPPLNHTPVEIQGSYPLS